MTSAALALVSCSATLASIPIEACRQKAQEATQECKARENFARAIVAPPMGREIARLRQIDAPPTPSWRHEVGAVLNLSEAQERARRERDAQPAEPSCDQP